MKIRDRTVSHPTAADALTWTLAAASLLIVGIALVALRLATCSHLP